MTIIAVDFDGTVVDHAYPIIGEPVPYAIYYLQEFILQKAKIMLWTMRSGSELYEAVNFLQLNGIELWGINVNPTQQSWTSSSKQYADIYIDDAAFGCPLIKIYGFNRPCVDWSIVGPAIIDNLKLDLK